MSTSNIIEFPGLSETTAAPEASRISWAQKAAVVVLQLGKQHATKVLNEFTDNELEQLSIEVARLGVVSSDLARTVMDEFAAVAEASDTVRAQGGLDVARSILEQALGTEAAEAMMERISDAFTELPFAFLHHVDTRQLASILGEEHPQTIAIVLVHLPAVTAASVLSEMSNDLRTQVAQRIATMDKVLPDIIKQLESSLHRRVLSYGVTADLSHGGGLQPLVAIINNSDRGTEQSLLQRIAERDADLADQIRANMFLFEDIQNLDDRSIQLLLRRVPSGDLAVALKGVSDGLRSKIMQNLSQRAALSLAEELDLLGPVRLTQVQEAQAGLVRTIREMEQDGEIVLSRGEADAMIG